jgi:hypothetical protein
MSPELEDISRELESATAHFTEQSWLWAPAGKWNSALIAEHLLLSYMSTTLGLLSTIHAGKLATSPVTMRTRIATFILTRLNYFPGGRSAPPQAMPKGRLHDGAIKRIYQALRTMDDRLTSAECLFGSKTKILDHPELGPLSAKEWRRFHRTHGLHHIKQIKRLARAHSILKHG